MSTVKTIITKEKFMNNGNLIIDIIKDKEEKPLKDKISSWLNHKYDFKDITRKKKGGKPGFNATDINKKLRANMKIIKGIHGESYVEYGSILSKGNKGFDFAVYDEEYYIRKLRNTFIGNPGRYNGDKELEMIYKNVKDGNDKSFKKSDWKKKLGSLGGDGGKNIATLEKSCLTVVGEIQFGNWALAEHDLRRLLNSERDGEIDFYIYITSTGVLESKLSDGIVSYDKIVKYFENNSQLIYIPTWIIGLDIESNNETS